MVYQSLDALNFTLDDVPSIPRPGRVLLTTPAHFDVEYVINPHMADHVGTVDQAAAQQQWAALRDAYAHLDFDVHVIDGVEGLPDMVFCANQTLPFYDPRDDTRGVVLSRMHAEQRQQEVLHYEHFFRHAGYVIKRLPPELETSFEGMGDGIWHPDRYLLWGGYGFRTGLTAYEYITDLLDVRVIALHLNDPDFYHLDTCFSVLNPESVLIYPGAFDSASLRIIHHFFDTVVEAPEDEARNAFACNAHCPDQTHVLIQAGCTVTNKRLRAAGFTPVERDTREFIKSGGSVFCMKLMYW